MWQQLTIHTSADKAEAISDLLTESGALAVTMMDAADQAIFEPPIGTTPLWQQTVLIGLYSRNIDLKSCISSISSQLVPEPMPRYSISELADKDWERECLDRFHAMRYGKNLWVCPSWRTTPAEAKTVVLLDPGLAFGTGTHPTTALCLEWLDENSVSDCQVIDFGCGSGVLGLAALKLGAQHVHAVDIDPQAILATQQNAQKNALSDSISTRQNGIIAGLVADILLANILSEPLIELAEKLMQHLRPGGKLILSGILENQAQQVIDRYSTWVDFSTQKALDGWVRLDATRRDR